MAEPELVVEEGGEVGHRHDQEGRHVDRHDLVREGSPQHDTDAHS